MEIYGFGLTKDLVLSPLSAAARGGGRSSWLLEELGGVPSPGAAALLT